MPGVVLCVLVILAGYLALEVGLFRLSCLLCGVPRPGFGASVGIVLLLVFAPAFTDGFQTAVLVEAYRAGGYPLWEAGIVDFVLALPVHMVLCSALHARLMGLRVRECLAVWFVEKLIKFGAVLAVAGVVALFVLAGMAKG